MDETSILRGHEYSTLFVDLVERKTLYISAGKDNKIAVDQVRREESRYTPELKENRYMFLKNKVNLREKQKKIKEELNLEKLNLKSI